MYGTRGTIDFLVDGEEFFPRFIDAVTRAEHSVDLRTYIFDNDDYAERIGELLKRRSNEGIDVRMLFDGFGTIVSTIEQQETLPDDWKGTSSVRAFLESEGGRRGTALREAARRLSRCSRALSPQGPPKRIFHAGGREASNRPRDRRPWGSTTTGGDSGWPCSPSCTR